MQQRSSKPRRCRHDRSQCGSQVLGELWIDAWGRPTARAAPLWHSARAPIPGERERLSGLRAVNQCLIAFLQARRPCDVATIDLDASILESPKGSGN